MNLKKIEELFANNLNIFNSDKELLRKAIIAEIDAVSLYEKFGKLAKNKKISKIFFDVAKEEKTHIGEFDCLLKILDREYKQESINGYNEVKKKLKNSTIKLK